MSLNYDCLLELFIVLGLFCQGCAPSDQRKEPLCCEVSCAWDKSLAWQDDQKWAPINFFLSEQIIAIGLLIMDVLRAFKRKGPMCFEVSYCLGQVTWRQHLQCVCYFFGLHLVRGCLFGGRVWDLTSSNQLLDKGKCWLSPTCQLFCLRSFFASWIYARRHCSP